MKRIISQIFIACLLMIPEQAYCQDSVLNDYIRIGLESNLALKQKELDYSQSLAALKEARGLFFPDISLNARYTVAEGGRMIEFPVGDLLNPVYNTLNMLTGSSSFPNVENMEFAFYRPKEHETKVTLVQPVLSTDLIYNYRIKNDLVLIGEADVATYRRELVMTITSAYYDLKKIYLLQKLADETLILVEENVRVSRKLFENDKVTVDVVYRSEAELARVKAQAEGLKSMEVAARGYFNFLLNRSLDEPVIQGEDIVPEIIISDPVKAQEEALSSREELDLLSYYRQLNRHQLKLYQGKNLPGVFAVANYGFQGEKYSFTADDDFVLASIVLQWDIFNGMSNRHKAEQVKLEGLKLDARITESENLIRLQVLNSWSAMNAASLKIESAEKELVSSKKAFEMIDRKYREGEASLLEYIDARTGMTNAGTDLILARTDFFIQKAAFERAAALSEIQ